MGYTTELSGKLSLSKELTDEQRKFINTFCVTRRMKRDVTKLMKLYKGKHGLPRTLELTEEMKSLSEKFKSEGIDVQFSFIGNEDKRTPEEIYGIEGEFFCLDDNNFGQTSDESIINYNLPPSSQPGLWCKWEINNRNQLEWNGEEKFYRYTEWLEYLIENFFSKWGVVLNGEIEWSGEERDDIGKIVVTNNVVESKIGKIVY